MDTLEAKLAQAHQFHKKGFNCAQAAMLPFCGELGIDPLTAKRALEGFGAGMGAMAQACGALSAAVFAAGLVHSDTELECPASKKETYDVCKTLCSNFESACGSCVCKELKGIDTGKPLTPCPVCIDTGVKLIYKMLQK